MVKSMENDYYPRLLQVGGKPTNILSEVTQGTAEDKQLNDATSSFHVGKTLPESTKELAKHLG